MVVFLYLFSVSRPLLVLTNEHKQRLQIDIFSPEQSTADLMISSDNDFSFFLALIPKHNETQKQIFFFFFFGKPYLKALSGRKPRRHGLFIQGFLPLELPDPPVTFMWSHLAFMCHRLACFRMTKNTQATNLRFDRRKPNYLVTTSHD